MRRSEKLTVTRGWNWMANHFLKRLHPNTSLPTRIPQTNLTELKQRYYLPSKTKRREACEPLPFFRIRWFELRQRFHVYVEFETASLLNTKQETNVQRSSIRDWSR